MPHDVAHDMSNNMDAMSFKDSYKYKLLNGKVLTGSLTILDFLAMALVIACLIHQ